MATEQSQQPLPTQPAFYVVGNSKIIYSLGQIVHDRPGFHTTEYIFPAGYKSSAILPSFVQPNTKVEYFQEVLDTGGPGPIFRITPSDSPENCVDDDVSCTGAWVKMLRLIAGGASAEPTPAPAPDSKESVPSDSPSATPGSAPSATPTTEGAPPTESNAPAPPTPDGPLLFGFREPDIRAMIEQLPGANMCVNYNKDVTPSLVIASGPIRRVTDPGEFIAILAQLLTPPPTEDGQMPPPPAGLDSHPMLALLMPQPPMYEPMATPGMAGYPPYPVMTPRQLQLPLAISQTVTLHCLGTIIHDRPGFHNQSLIFPANFRSTKKFYSSVGNGVCEYINEIIDTGEDNPLFRVTASDNLELCVEGSSPSGVWKIIRERINASQNARQSKSCFVNGPQYFGLSHPTVMKLIEQLPGADKCTRYTGAKRVTSVKRGAKGPMPGHAEEHLGKHPREEGEEGASQAEAGQATPTGAAASAGELQASPFGAAGMMTPAGPMGMMGAMGPMAGMGPMGGMMSPMGAVPGMLWGMSEGVPEYDSEEAYMLEFMLSRSFEIVRQKRKELQERGMMIQKAQEEVARLQKSLAEVSQTAEVYRSQSDQYHRLFDDAVARIKILEPLVPPPLLAQVQQAEQQQQQAAAQQAQYLTPEQQQQAAAQQAQYLTPEQQQQQAAAQQAQYLTPEQQQQQAAAQQAQYLTPEQQQLAAQAAQAAQQAQAQAQPYLTPEQQQAMLAHQEQQQQILQQQQQQILQQQQQQQGEGAPAPAPTDSGMNIETAPSQ